MIPALETAGFFLAITAVLHFSSWAEGWLVATAGLVKERAAHAEPSVVRDFPKQGIEQASGGVAQARRSSEFGITQIIVRS